MQTSLPGAIPRHNRNPCCLPLIIEHVSAWSGNGCLGCTNTRPPQVPSLVGTIWQKKRQEINTNNYIMSFEQFKYCSEAGSVLVSTENSKYD